MHSLRLLWAAHNENTWERRQKRLRQRRQLETIEDMPELLFIQHFRLNKKAFRKLCNDLKSHAGLKGSSEIPLEIKVLCALSFLATGSYQKIVGVGQHLTQRTTSRCIREVVNALNHNWMVSRWIVFPQTPHERSLIKEKFQRTHNLPGVIGCVDCTHIAITRPVEEEHMFFNRKGYHSLNVQMICDYDLRIINVNAKFGGATHDSHIWSASHVVTYMKGLHESGEHVWLLGDSGYPQRPWLMTPILNAEPGSQQEVYTRRHVQARSRIERCFGLFKARWRCMLRHRVLHYHPYMASKITNACCVLHNIALDARIPPPSDMPAPGLEDATQYAHYVFKTIKHKQSGKVNFEEFLDILSRVARGSIQEKLSWVFTLYDVDGDGRISRSEMLAVVQAIYELLGRAAAPPVHSTAAKDHVDRIFHLMDTNCDGVVTPDELARWCSRDPALLNSLDTMDTVL